MVLQPRALFPTFRGVLYLEQAAFEAFFETKNISKFKYIFRFFVTIFKQKNFQVTFP